MGTSVPETIYEHTQPGYAIGSIFIGTGLLIVLAMFTAEGQSASVVTGVLGLMFIGAVLFSSLTVSVTRATLKFYFGPGFWSKRIPVGDITSIRVVQNSWWYGWGIRYTPHGWLYNVSGLQAVEIEIEGDRSIRIGTDKPERLKKALLQARSKD